MHMIRLTTERKRYAQPLFLSDCEVFTVTQEQIIYLYTVAHLKRKRITKLKHLQMADVTSVYLSVHFKQLCVSLPSVVAMVI